MTTEKKERSDKLAPLKDSLVTIERFKSDPRFLAEFMEQPKIKIAEFLTGALAQGPSDWTLIGGRLVQGILKGQFITQFARELQALILKGQIPEDYAEKTFGFQTLSELLQFIDEQTVDETRLLAVQAMFLAVNAIDAKEGDRIVNYQLFQIAKRLNSMELLVIKTAYSLFKEVMPGETFRSSASEWLTEIARRQGHQVKALIESAEEALMREHLLSSRVHPDLSGINPKNVRLTDLGIRFCENIDRFEAVKSDS